MVKVLIQSIFFSRLISLKKMLCIEQKYKPFLIMYLEGANFLYYGVCPFLLPRIKLMLSKRKPLLYKEEALM
ncbi:hypothetical protein DZB86_30385 [Bacillus sp. RC]|nr:hypothetical protein DZB86_30385 [Bacillus sp. RC]